MYRATDLSRLTGIGWKYNSKDEMYVYQFTVSRYKSTPTIIGKITVDANTKDVAQDVYNVSSGLPYVPFYWNYYGAPAVAPILDKINKKFLAEFKKWGIKEKKNGNNCNKRKMPKL